jgi:hypothetical protein
VTPAERDALITRLVTDPDLAPLLEAIRYGYVHRTLLADDELIQAHFNFGMMGVSISARSGTAKAHGHRWGCWLCDFLDWAKWLGFGKDPVTGQGHCESAIQNDRLRALATLKELEGYDNVR